MWFLYFLSSLLFSLVKIFALVFYRVKSNWVGEPPPEKPWSDDIRLFVFLNHTSLFEPLFVGALPFDFIFWGAPRIVVPGANKTLSRMFVGTFFKLLCPRMISITRKRDSTWNEFLSIVVPGALVVILPEGRMMRRTGIDREGKAMTIRGGIADILEKLDDGRMVIGYSGGLHHVQAPEEWAVHLFKTIRINFESIPIRKYKQELLEKGGSDGFKSTLIKDLTDRLKKHCPVEYEQR